ncbi:cofilin-1-like [Clavelina lepadiformis]|uniref:ADF-H domain-containing protein n=1 Tax=Clavelina lepadiformis TaxID=159417 RepID=A0ABP0G3P4_CLALP
MVKSGIKISAEVKQLHSQFKTKQSNEKKVAAFILKFSDDSKSVVPINESILYDDCATPYSTTVQSFPKDSCRFALVDIKYKDTEGKYPNKIALITWAPEDAGRGRILVPSTLDALKSELEGSLVHVQMCDEDDKDITNVLERVASKAVVRFEEEDVYFDASGKYVKGKAPGQ